MTSSVPFRKRSPFIFYNDKYIEMICDPNYNGSDIKNLEFVKNDTVWTLLTHMAKEVPDLPLFGTRQYDKEAGKFTDYKFISYAETVELASQYASGLVELGLKKGDVCTEYFNNRTEWVINDLALFRQGATASPFRNDLNSDYFKQIITVVEPSLAVVSADNLDNLFDICDHLVKNDVPLTYKFIVVMPQPMGPLYGTESISKDQYERAKTFGLRLIKWEEVMALGKEHPHTEEEADPSALHSILFTSGTTSDKPKGVPIAQRGMLAFQSRQAHHKQYTLYSYVHMSHVSDRALITHTISTQSCIGFASGTTATMLDDLESLRPTFLAATPIFIKTIQSKALDLIRTGIPEDTVKAIFRKKFGGRCHRCANFGAPCPEELCRWVIEFLDMEFSSTYGLTESAASVTMTPYSKTPVPFGCIGQPGPLATVRLIDVPELGCSIKSDPPCGELLIRNAGNMTGYLKNPEKTKAAIDDEGFLHTNDIVQLNDDGTLTIIDRRDNMMKLASAAYIPPEQIESFLGSSHLVAQSWVHARNQDDFVVGVVVPNLGVLANDPRLPAGLKAQALAAAKDPESADAAALCVNEKVNSIFMDEFADIAKKNHFPKYWLAKGVLIEPIRWTEENGILTFTNKLKRRALVAKYGERLDELIAKF